MVAHLYVLVLSRKGREYAWTPVPTTKPHIIGGPDLIDSYINLYDSGLPYIPLNSKVLDEICLKAEALTLLISLMRVYTLTYKGSKMAFIKHKSG